jgi:hypothetical protein
MVPTRWIVRPGPRLRNTNYLVQTSSDFEPSLLVVRCGASTPEQLDSPLEDRFVAGEASSLAELFEAAAIVALDGAGSETRDSTQIEELADQLCGCGYITSPRRVFQTGGIALVVAQHGTSAIRQVPTAYGPTRSRS